MEGGIRVLGFQPDWLTPGFGFKFYFGSSFWMMFEFEFECKNCVSDIYVTWRNGHFLILLVVNSDLEDAGWLILRVRRGKMKFEFGPLIFFVESPLCLRILFQSSIIDIGLLYCTPQLELYKKVWDSVRNWFRLELIWFDS
jgi:hypothetical protein